jgi:hypothetical protein
MIDANTITIGPTITKQKIDSNNLNIFNNFPIFIII